MTPQDVIDHHAAEAGRYVQIARNWTDMAVAEARRADARPNPVRSAGLHQCARAAMAIAQSHLDMAHALSPLMGAPLMSANAVRQAEGRAALDDRLSA